MLKKLFVLPLTAAVMLFFSTSCNKDSKVKLETEMDTISYVVGMYIGKQNKETMEQQKIEFNGDALAAGLRDIMSPDAEPLFDEKEMNERLMAFQMKLMEARNKEQSKASEKTRKEAAAWLAENKKKEGVKETASGLQYKIINEGKGDNPKDGDIIYLSYKGSLIDGTVFDETSKHGENWKQDTFTVGHQIPGFVEGIKLMKPGAKYEIYISPDLGYGDRVDPEGPIPAGAALIFEIDLLGVKKGGEAKQLPK